MLSDHLILIVAMGGFVASIVSLTLKRAVVSPQCFAAATFLLSGVFVLAPELRYSSNRAYVLSDRCQYLLLFAAVSLFASCLLMRRPEVLLSYPPIRWRLWKQQVWLSLFMLICLLDPLVSIVSYGQVGLTQGNASMGSSGSHSDVFSPLTYLAWAVGAMAVYMVAVDFLISQKTFSAYLPTKWFDLGCVLVCLFCNSLSGNRFLLVFQVLLFLCALALFSKLRVWLTLGAMLAMGVFFIIIGNFRFGAIDVRDNLAESTGSGEADTVMGWVTAYTEPIYPTLDNFLMNQPEKGFGARWITSVMPTPVLDALGLERDTTAQYIARNKLLAHRGLTFRTMYADLTADFGYSGAAIAGLLVMLAGTLVYNRALNSPFSLLLFFLISQFVLWAPLLAAFYQLPPLSSFLILAILKPSRVKPEAVQKQSLLERSRELRGSLLAP